MRLNMMRKSLIAALGFVGLVAAGTMASATPASAGYACGPWNGWCSFYAKPSFGYGWYGGYRKPYYGSRYGSRDYGRNHWRGDKKYNRGGKRHTDKRSNRRHYR